MKKRAKLFLVLLLAACGSGSIAAPAAAASCTVAHLLFETYDGIALDVPLDQQTMAPCPSSQWLAANGWTRIGP